VQKALQLIHEIEKEKSFTWKGKIDFLFLKAFTYHMAGYFEKALEIAENINYSEYFNLSRFSSHWANFIDHTTINHYSDLIELYKNNQRQTYVSMNYTVNVGSYSKISIINNSDNFTITNDDEIIQQINHYYYHFFNKQYYCKILINGSLQLIKGNYSIDFENCIIIDMCLDYIDRSGPLGAVFVCTYQIIILDNDFNVILIKLCPSDHLVS
ncbi:MAG: hypothetical protein JSV49_03360, partial [Thermoplasmata archaeon]